jgi:hypothetical protein
VTLSRVVNCDKTAWLLYPNRVRTWAEHGSESIQVKISGNEKDCVTVLTFVTTVSTKIPLVFIAAGRTGSVEQSQIRNVEGHWRTHSKSGWEASGMFQDYLAKLRSAVGEGAIHLLLDSYSAHRPEAVKQAAVKLGTSLHCIPPSLADEFEPLNQALFEVLKAQAKRLFQQDFI